MYGSEFQAKQKRPKPTWVYYFAAFVCLFVIAFGWLTQRPWDIPDEADLVETGGDIARFYVRDDVFGSSAGSVLPILGSAYIHFKGIDGAFRYPWTHPQYEALRREFGVAARIWVRESELEAMQATGEPPRIWGIREENPYKNEDFPPVVVTPAEMVAAKLTSAQALKRNSLILLGVALMLVGVARTIAKSNRRNFPAHYGIRSEE